MSHRVEVPISAELDALVAKAAEACRISREEWILMALEHALGRVPLRAPGRFPMADPVMRLAALNGPTADIEQMLAETAAGRL